MGTNIGRRKISKNDYLAGVAIANSPVWFFVAIRDIVFAGESDFSLWLIAFGTASLGGALAGYLVARRTGQNYQSSGLTVGLLAYVAYATLSFLVRFRTVYLEDVAVIFGFAIGSTIGAQYWLAPHKGSG